MKKIKIWAYISIIINASALSVEFWTINHQIWMGLILFISFFWWLGIRYRIYWLRTLLLVLGTILAAIGIIFNGSTIFALFTVLSGVNVWAFSDMFDQSILVRDPTDLNMIYKGAFIRWIAIDLVSLILTIPALFIKINIKLSIAIFFGLLVIFGLSQLVGYLNRESN